MNNARTGMSNTALSNFIDQIETLEYDKTAVSDKIKSVYAEAKSAGYDPRVMKEMVRLRKLEASKRSAYETTRTSYMEQLQLL